MTHDFTKIRIRESKFDDFKAYVEKYPSIGVTQLSKTYHMTPVTIRRWIGLIKAGAQP